MGGVMEVVVDKWRERERGRGGERESVESLAERIQSSPPW